MRRFLCAVFLLQKSKPFCRVPRQERSFMFQEEMNKIREAENEADRRLAECEATVKKMKEEAQACDRASLENAKKAAAHVRDEKKAEAVEELILYKAREEMRKK